MTHDSLPMTTLRIGTRKSPLALAQAEEVRAKLLAAWPALQIEMVKITTSGDKFLQQPLAEIGGKGLFTKELEEALLAGEIDCAVHSMKDVPTVLPDGLTIGCMLPREDARDALICVSVQSLAELPQGATFGTSSLRRAAQVLMKRPDIRIVPLRGNVQTRLEKIMKGEVDATMLARAGLNRLGLHDIPAYDIPIYQNLPAIAQGAVGVECRAGDARVLELLAPLACAQTEIAVNCERAFLRVLDGSCRTPIAGYAHIEGELLHFSGLKAAPDGTSHQAVAMEGNAREPEALGVRAGEALFS